MTVTLRRTSRPSPSSDQGEAPQRRLGRPRCEDSRRSILKAAIALLKTNDLPAISADAIAERAGVSKATIYRWWPNKSAIVMEAFLEMVAPHTRFPETDSAMEDLRVHLGRVAEVCQSDIGRMLRTLIADSQANAELAAAMRAHYFSVRRADARKVIERGIASGEFRGDLDTEAAIDCLYGPIVFRLMINPVAPDAEFVNRMIALLRQAFLKRSDRRNVTGR
ncbi:MAG: TetR/AcrR family transcriptional regulator [Rhodospirillales bacterium]|nr:TetR/AcrR family transcriptional regulator [Rhodospirillales bacterium]